MGYGKSANVYLTVTLSMKLLTVNMNCDKLLK